MSSTPPPSSPTPTATTSDVANSFQTSSIIRFTIAAGIIVLGITAIILFAKIGSFIRRVRRTRTQKRIAQTTLLEDEAVQFEVAAWAAVPGSAPVGSLAEIGREAKRRTKQRERDVKVMRRKGGNAYMVEEWEGVAQ